MTQEHSITPPPELVEQWRATPEYTDLSEKIFVVSLTTKKLQDIATQAAQWGADQELEACCEWLGDAPVVYNDNGDLHPGSYLRDARRPRPSLKEQALARTDAILNDPGRALLVEVRETLELNSRALEALDD